MPFDVITSPTTSAGEAVDVFRGAVRDHLHTFATQPPIDRLGRV